MIRHIAALAFAAAVGFAMMLASGALASAASSATVTINGDAFTAKTITIAHGQTVTFINKDDEAHTVTADDRSFDSEPMRGTFAHRFTKPGRYAYHCEIHPFMHGVVIVK